MANDATYALEWDKESEKLYETGCDHGVLYVKRSKTSSSDEGTSILGIKEAKTFYSNGVVWNGLTSVSKSPSGAEANDIYADNIKYASLRSAETFGGTIEAYMYPPEFAECDGSAVVGNGVYVGQQRRKMFGFAFRSDIGSAAENGIDVDNDYKIHLIYNATASPSEQSFSTINDSPEAITMSWELTTLPEVIGTIGSGSNAVSYLPTATLTIDATKFTTEAEVNKLKAFEQILYGTPATTSTVGGETVTVDAVDPMLPMPKDVIAFFTAS